MHINVTELLLDIKQPEQPSDLVDTELNKEAENSEDDLVNSVIDTEPEK